MASGTYAEDHQKQALGTVQANVEAIVEFGLCFLSRKKRKGPFPDNVTAIWVEISQETSELNPQWPLTSLKTRSFTQSVKEHNVM